MKIAITILVLGAIVGGTFYALQPNDIIQPTQLNTLEFEVENISVKRENIEIVTSTDELGNTIKTGIRVPIKYNFPVATSSGYIIEEIEEYVEMNFDGFTMCRQKGKTKNQCLKELKDDIEATLEAKQENIIKRLEELKRLKFRNEITEADL